MKLNIPKDIRQFVEAVDFYSDGDGETGWIVYLKSGYSFDPGSDDGSRFLPIDEKNEIKEWVIYELDD